MQAFTFLYEEQHEGLCGWSGMSYRDRLGDKVREIGRMVSLMAQWVMSKRTTGMVQCNDSSCSVFSSQVNWFELV